MQRDDGEMATGGSRDDHPLEDRVVYDVHHQHGLEEGVAELRVEVQEGSRLLWRGDDEAL